MKDLIATLRSYSYPFNTEKECQLAIEKSLVESGYKFTRECDLRPTNGKGIIDFLMDDGVGIEVKIGGQKTAIYRQCRDYCDSSQIKGLILLTSKMMGMPEEINGKPVQVVSMGWAHL